MLCLREHTGIDIDWTGDLHQQVSPPPPHTHTHTLYRGPMLTCYDYMLRTGVINVRPSAKLGICTPLKSQTPLTFRTKPSGGRTTNIACIPIQNLNTFAVTRSQSPREQNALHVCTGIYIDWTGDSTNMSHPPTPSPHPLAWLITGHKDTCLGNVVASTWQGTSLIPAGVWLVQFNLQICRYSLISISAYPAYCTLS